jgi:Rrf2 family iron-sulfur cluster assembly transcriptional regulator
MRITAKSRIAVDAILDIAAHTEKGYAISLPVVSKRLSVSHSYLELIFSKLKAAGLIHSHRGPGGGYSLAKRIESISVKDIVDATIDPPVLVSGLSAQLWGNLEAHMQNQMSQITLHQILANTPIKIDPTLESLGAKLVKPQERKQSDKMPAKIPIRKERQALGPNSVFSFGKFILQN